MNLQKVYNQFKLIGDISSNEADLGEAKLNFENLYNFSPKMGLKVNLEKKLTIK